MDPGRMDRRVSLFRRRPKQNEATGEDEGAWRPFATDAHPYAEVKAVAGDEVAGAEVAAATTTKEFIIWWRGDVTVEDRVVYEGRAYDIKAVDEIGRREGLRIRGESRAER